MSRVERAAVSPPDDDDRATRAPQSHIHGLDAAEGRSSIRHEREDGERLLRTAMAPEAVSDSTQAVRAVAADVFGHPSLRPGQEEAMEGLLEGQDVLLVAPTGFGKSLTYQVPAVLLDGCTVVVSPLLSLQQDQLVGLAVGGRHTRGVRISSAESPAQQDAAFEELARGEAQFLFLSPEQLARPEIRERVRALRPSLVAVDEAHCVSTWGHDFRPDYFFLGDNVDAIGRPPVIALTATAAPPVREDVATRLRLRNARTIVAGFARENLVIGVLRCHNAEDQRRAVVEAVRDAAGPGIVYCRTRKAVEEYAAALGGIGASVVGYHAGLGKKRREDAHERFSRGSVDVMVATSAFGMGIDKADIRYVLHAQVPESLDTYYQEFGRAGRDGQPASAVLFYRSEDLALGRYFSSPTPRRDDVTEVLRVIPLHGEIDRELVRRSTGLSARRVGRIVNLIDEATLATSGRTDRSQLVDAIVARAEGHRRLEQSRVDMMRAYAETDRCRWEFICGYFGEATDPCGHCDTCETGGTEGRSDVTGDYQLQSRVRHRTFGDGTVMDIEGGKLTVLFEDSGYRTLDLDLVEEQRILTRSPSG
jgi:ATP-dependent DNA helicase RecQ